MMPGVGFEEMILLVVVAIIVVGPKDLPLMMRKFGRFTGKMRAMAFEFKQGIDELGRQAELEELRKEVASLKAHTGLDDLRNDLENERRALDNDIASVTAPVPPPSHPALGPSQASLAPPGPAPYVGLSAEHPGYDTGEAAPVPAGAGAYSAGPDNPTRLDAVGAGAGDPHIIPDSHVGAGLAPVKQDTQA